MKYEVGQVFLLNQNIDWEMSTVHVKAPKDSEIEIIELDTSDGETPYKVFIRDAENWVFLSEYEVDSITQSAIAKH